MQETIESELTQLQTGLSGRKQLARDRDSKAAEQWTEHGLPDWRSAG